MSVEEIWPNPDANAAERWRRKDHAEVGPAARTVRVPTDCSTLRRLMAFVGPGCLVAVGYMDPGNWATDISGGSLFGYTLLSVVMIANFVAIFLQSLSAKLGLVTGRDLAQACRDTYPKWVSIMLWLSAQIAIVACDVAEVIGAGIALNLLFHLPLLIGCSLTALDVILVLALQGRGWRLIEALVAALILTIMAIFGIELFYAHPAWNQVLHGFVPQPQIVTRPNMLYLALGILGATVMPHNLYLHSAIVKTRHFDDEPQSTREALRYTNIDTTTSLMFALLVNAAILIVAAATFHRFGHHEIGDIQSAYHMLTPIVGAGLASPLFAIALLASGQNATLTGTLAGQVVMEGFTHYKIPQWAQRVVSRGLALIPTLAVVAVSGMAGTGKLLIFSQVVLSLQLSFAVIPLVQITSDRRKLGEFANGAITKIIGWVLAAAILVLNLYLVYGVFTGKQ